MLEVVHHNGREQSCLMPECFRDWCRSCASAIGLRRAHNQRPYRTLPPTQMPSTQTWAMRASRPKPTHFQPADYPMATPLPNPSLPMPLHPLVPPVSNTPRHSCFTSLHNRFSATWLHCPLPLHLLSLNLPRVLRFTYAPPSTPPLNTLGGNTARDREDTTNLRRWGNGTRATWSARRCWGEEVVDL